MSSLYRQALLNQGRSIGTIPDKRTKRHDNYSDGKRFGPGRLQTAWSWVYECSEFEWKQHFPEMVGSPFLHECDQLNDSIYTPVDAGGDLRAEENVAFAIAMRTRLVQQMTCGHSLMACMKGDLRHHVWLTIKCIRSCLCDRANYVHINDPIASDDSDELHTVNAAFEQRRADQLISRILRRTNKTSKQQPSSDRKSLLRGPLYEQCPIKLDEKTVVPDMTIVGNETMLAAPHHPVYFTIVTVEVKIGPLTLRDLRQSFCQGIAAALKDGIEGSRQPTRSILINQTSMIVVEYSLDDEFIRSVVENKRRASEILTAEIKGVFQVVYRGPFDLRLPEKLVRAVFIGLVAPEFQSHIDLATLRANLTSVLRRGTIGSLSACQAFGFDVPRAFKRFAALPAEDDTIAVDALCMACLSGKYPETAEEKENKKRKREESKDDVAANLDQGKRLKLLGNVAAAQAGSKLEHDKPLRQAVFALRDPYRHIQLIVKKILGTSDLTTFSMSDLLERLRTHYGDITNFREIIESTAIEFTRAQLDQGAGFLMWKK